MSNYTYILALHTQGNYSILAKALGLYPDLTQERRVKFVFKKSEGDLVDDEGGLLVPFDASQYIYMKATTNELDFELLEGVADYQLFTIDTQPFNEYWL